MWLVGCELSTSGTATALNHLAIPLDFVPESFWEIVVWTSFCKHLTENKCEKII